MIALGGESKRGQGVRGSPLGFPERTGNRALGEGGGNKLNRGCGAKKRERARNTWRPSKRTGG